MDDDNDGDDNDDDDKRFPDDNPAYYSRHFIEVINSRSNC